MKNFREEIWPNPLLFRPHFEVFVVAEFNCRISQIPYRNFPTIQKGYVHLFMFLPWTEFNQNLIREWVDHTCNPAYRFSFIDSGKVISKMQYVFRVYIKTEFPLILQRRGFLQSILFLSCASVLDAARSTNISEPCLSL